MHKTADHPSQEQLTAYNLGLLPPDEAVAIENHISTCDPCCDTVACLSTDDTFVGLLQKAKRLPADQTVDYGAAVDSLASQEVPKQLAEHPRYEVLGLIGKGGMGEVYKARHRKMERTVALKVINRGIIRRAEAIDRFHREVKAAAQLSHPNIVTAHDADQAGDYHFMVMEFVDGVDLSHIVKDRGPLPIADACDYVRQAANGLQHAYERGMVHRDIKPHNLMVTADGTVKILDFGLASLAPETVSEEGSADSAGELTLAGAIMGTPDFISPEQAQDARQADIRSDIYSLGATLYFLLTGRPLFADGTVLQKLMSHVQSEPEPLELLRSDVPAELATIFAKMTAKAPEARYQTPGEVASALESLGKHDQVVQRPEPQLQTLPIRSRNQWLPLTAIATILVASIFASFLYYVQNDNVTVADASPTSFSYDLSLVPEGAFTVYGYRPSLLHQDKRFERLMSKVSTVDRPVAHLFDANIKQLLNIRWEPEGGGRTLPILALTVIDGTATDFARQKLGVEIGDQLSDADRWKYHMVGIDIFGSNPGEQFVRFIDDKTLVLASKENHDAHQIGLKSRSSNHLQSIASSLPDCAAWMLGSSKHQEFVQQMTFYSNQFPLTGNLMSESNFWQETSHLAFALALDDSPILQMSAYAVSPDKQKDVSRFAKPLPVALASSLRAFENGLGPFDADTIGAVMKTLSETTVTEPSETETRITVPLKDAESHLFRAFNSYLDLQGPNAGDASRGE